jgi:predicted GIY-YIG superfamily endonuclease
MRMPRLKISRGFFIYRGCDLSTTLNSLLLPQQSIIATNIRKRANVIANPCRTGVAISLIIYEQHPSARIAINREKQLKAGSRMKKLDLIKSMNPTFADLYYELIQR